MEMVDRKGGMGGWQAKGGGSSLGGSRGGVSSTRIGAPQDFRASFGSLNKPGQPAPRLAVRGASSAGPALSGKRGGSLGASSSSSSSKIGTGALKGVSNVPGMRGGGQTVVIVPPASKKHAAVGAKDDAKAPKSRKEAEKKSKEDKIKSMDTKDSAETSLSSGTADSLSEGAREKRAGELLSDPTISTWLVEHKNDVEIAIKK